MLVLSPGIRRAKPTSKAMILLRTLQPPGSVHVLNARGREFDRQRKDQKPRHVLRPKTVNAVRAPLFGKKNNKRDYTTFRHSLLKEGFSQIQYSVYARYCPNSENTKKYKNINSEG